MKALEQPVLGIVATLIVAVLTMIIISLFEEPVFGSWVAFLFMACVPTQIVCGLVWQCGYPGFTQGLSQPARGLAFLVITLIGGAICASSMLLILGDGEPSPQLILYTIFTIVATFWFVAVWRTWPVSAIANHPLLIGIGVLLVCYVGGYLLFYILFDFTFLEGAPIYVAALDPKGAFMAWQVMSFCVTTVAVIMFCILCDFWPVSGSEKAQASPLVFGLLASVWILLVAAVIFYLCTSILKLDYVVYMVRGPVSFIFGAFIALNLMQNSLFFKLTAQPVRGLVLALVCLVLAAIMQTIYEPFAALVSGSLSAGAPTYQLEIWMANAMLAVSFPLIVLLTDFMQLWPLAKTSEAEK